MFLIRCKSARGSFRPEPANEWFTGEGDPAAVFYGTAEAAQAVIDARAKPERKDELLALDEKTFSRWPGGPYRGEADFQAEYWKTMAGNERGPGKWGDRRSGLQKRADEYATWAANNPSKAPPYAD